MEQLKIKGKNINNKKQINKNKFLYNLENAQ